MRPKTKEELQLAGTYRADRHTYLDHQIEGDTVTAVEPVRGWRKQVKEQFQYLTESLLHHGLIHTQDIPSLYQLGEYLSEIDYITRELKTAKKAEELDLDQIMRLQSQKIKLVKAYTELAKSYYVTPQARHKAAAMMGKAEAEIKKSKAEELIASGTL